MKLRPNSPAFVAKRAQLAIGSFRSLIGIILFASAIEVPILSLTICHIGIARWPATGNCFMCREITPNLRTTDDRRK